MARKEGEDDADGAQGGQITMELDQKNGNGGVKVNHDGGGGVAGMIKQNVILLRRAVETSESRFTTRVLRTTAGLRQKLNKKNLGKAIELYLPEDLEDEGRNKKRLLDSLDYSSGGGDDNDGENNTMAIDSSKVSVSSSSDPSTLQAAQTAAQPEVEIYLRLLTMIHLLDLGQIHRGQILAQETVQQIQMLNRRTLDQLSSRVFFYYARFYELADDGAHFADIRPTLLAFYRTASLRRDAESQATLLNLLLRNYFAFNLVAQADALLSKSTFPEAAAGNGQIARYFYHLGRIRAIQLNYSQSRDCLQQAIRKAPQPESIALATKGGRAIASAAAAAANSSNDLSSMTPVLKGSAAGFQQAVHKVFVIVELLMGDIPDRALFRQPILRKALQPYLFLVQAVRAGNLELFQKTIEQYEKSFRSDKTWTLILRLRHNVIKTALRMISLAYSRISLRDICQKLRLDSEEDAEYIVGKAIRDGVIEAAIDHEGGFMRSKESADIYASAEPGGQFNQRITFCMDLHNESVKAMRFPLNAHRKELKSAEEARERERELAKEIQDGDLDDEGDDFGDL